MHIEFLPPPKELNLTYGEVHVWCANLEEWRPYLEEFYELLSEDERQRAARFYFPHLRENYILRCSILRHLLSHYTTIPERKICFQFGKHGKPFLAGKKRATQVEFNVSHSHELSLFAFVKDRDVGVDIEKVRPDLDFASIARRYFSAQEIEQLFSLPEEKQAGAFFQGWTYKEAIIKAEGSGLSIPLDCFSVTMHPEEEAELLEASLPSLDHQLWTLRRLSPAEGYAAALAVKEKGVRVSCWRYSRNAFI